MAWCQSVLGKQAAGAQSQTAAQRRPCPWAAVLRAPAMASAGWGPHQEHRGRPVPPREAPCGRRRPEVRCYVLEKGCWREPEEGQGQASVMCTAPPRPAWGACPGPVHSRPGPLVSVRGADAVSSLFLRSPDKRSPRGAPGAALAPWSVHISATVLCPPGTSPALRHPPTLRLCSRPRTAASPAPS